MVGEEEYGDGSLALIEAVRAPLVVVSEPTDLRPCISHNGYQEFRLTAQGSRAHAAVPEFGANAIHAMLTWILAILRRPAGPGPGAPGGGQPPGDPGGQHPVRGARRPARPCWTCTGGRTWNPSAVAAALERSPPGGVPGTTPLCRLEAEATFTSTGYENDPEDPLLAPFWRALARTGLGLEPSVFRSHSDAAVFQRAGALAVVCGPGRLEMAHSPEEMVSLAQVEHAARLYAAPRLGSPGLSDQPTSGGRWRSRSGRPPAGCRC